MEDELLKVLNEFVDATNKLEASYRRANLAAAMLIFAIVMYVVLIFVGVARAQTPTPTPLPAWMTQDLLYNELQLNACWLWHCTAFDWTTGQQCQSSTPCIKTTPTPTPLPTASPTPCPTVTPPPQPTPWPKPTPCAPCPQIDCTAVLKAQKTHICADALRYSSTVYKRMFNDGTCR